MAKHAAAATKLLPVLDRGTTALAERLNRQVLQVLEDLPTEIETDPGIEDEYEFELFGDTGPTPIKKQK